MLTREVYPRLEKSVSVSEGGRGIAGSDWARLYNRGGNYRGDRLLEAGTGFECCSVLTDGGELLEAVVTDNEVVVGVNNAISAAYDRVGGFLISASFSLVSGVIDACLRGILDLPDDLYERAKELKVRGDDLVVVVEFDEDGEAKLFLVRTEGDRVVQLIKIIGHDAMLSVGENETFDFVVEEEEELVGELLYGWCQACPIFDFAAEFGVGIRTQVLDFSVIDVENEEAMPYHANMLLDPSRLDETRLTVEMVRDLVRQAFPESGWG